MEKSLNNILKDAKKEGFEWYKDNGVTERIDLMLKDWVSNGAEKFVLKESYEGNKNIKTIYEIDKQGYHKQEFAKVYKSDPRKIK